VRLTVEGQEQAVGISHDVSLPKGYTPEFPDMCVCCLQRRPDSSFVPQGGAVSWWTAFLMFTPGRRIKPIAPACRSCARRMTWMRRLRFAGWMVAIAVAAYTALALRRNFVPDWPKWTAFVGTIALLVPYAITDMLLPQHYDVTETPKTIQYEFKSRVYAMLFAAHNASGLTSNRSSTG
jgi:hypothetical protein